MAKLQVEKRNGLFDLKPLYEWMRNALDGIYRIEAVSYTHLRAHET